MDLPTLGVGITYSTVLDDFLEVNVDLVDFIEVEPEMLWRYVPGQLEAYKPDLAAIERLKAFPQPKLVHGVGFPVGGSRPPDPSHVGPLVWTIEELEAPWASEHLGFNHACGPDGAFNTGFLLPPLQTSSGVASAVASIQQVAGLLPVPFAVETGVNYLRPRKGEISDGEFVAAVATAAGCGILLDMHNIWANEANGRQSVEDFVAAIPLDRVWEIHVAGGVEHRGFWLDAHSGGMPEPVVAAVSNLLPHLPNLRAITYEIQPTWITVIGFDGLRAEIDRVRRLWEMRPKTVPPTAPTQDSSVHWTSDSEVDSRVSPAEWEDTLGALVVGREVISPLADKLSSDAGIDLLRKLVRDFRAGMIVDTLTLTVRLLMLSRGSEYVRELFNTFFANRPPELFGSAEGEAFAAFLEELGPDVMHLPQVSGFERAALSVLQDGKARTVQFRCEPRSLLEALGEGHLPDSVVEGSYEIEVTPDTEYSSYNHERLLTTT